MISYPNRLFKGWCSNSGNDQSRILHYNIYTIRDIKDYSGEVIPEQINTLEEYFSVDSLGIGEPYYAIYATFKFDIQKGQIKIFETNELRLAVYIIEQLSGNEVIENEN